MVFQIYDDELFFSSGTRSSKVFAGILVALRLSPDKSGVLRPPKWSRRDKVRDIYFQFRLWSHYAIRKQFETWSITILSLYMEILASLLVFIANINGIIEHFLLTFHDCLPRNYSWNINKKFLHATSWNKTRATCTKKLLLSNFSDINFHITRLNEENENVCANLTAIMIVS